MFVLVVFKQIWAPTRDTQGSWSSIKAMHLQTDERVKELRLMLLSIRPYLCPFPLPGRIQPTPKERAVIPAFSSVFLP